MLSANRMTQDVSTAAYMSREFLTSKGWTDLDIKAALEAGIIANYSGSDTSVDARNFFENLTIADTEDDE